MRVSIRRFALVILLFFLGGTIYSAIYVNYIHIHRLYQDIFIFEQFDSESFKASDLIIKNEIHYPNYVYSGYKDFISSFNSKSLSAIKALPLEEKCQAVFEQFHETDPDWKFPSFVDPDYLYDKSIENKQGYFHRAQDRLRKTRPEDERNITYRDNIGINNDFNRQIMKTKQIEQKMADITTLMRLYDKCFIKNDDQLTPNLKELYDRFTSKLFHYITPNLPLFQLSDHREIPANEFPVLNKDNEFLGDTISFDPEKENIIEFIHKHSNGRGIVISATTRHAKDLTRLIRILRALNNKLPIQILYKGDINKRSKEYIELTATCDVEFLLNKEHTNIYEKFMPELDLLNDYKSYGSEFPKQQVMFVNIVHTIAKNFKYGFPGYSNKVLALLFSSFKEIIMLDADTVPLVQLEHFFNSEEYLNSKTYFFRDRTLRDINSYIETNYFTKLMPSSEKSIDVLFDIPRITDKTLKNNYMTGFRHHQEAGVVVIDKVEHFGGLLMGLPLSLWREPVKSSIWGDKEMYWLGLSMAGDENYEFNKYEAASVGEFTVKNDHKYYTNTKAKEICSSHPGHVGKDGKLLWINSGFGYCKKNGYYRDRVKHPFALLDPEELNVLFSSPLKIRAAIVPPKIPYFRQPYSPTDSTAERAVAKKWKERKKDVDEISPIVDGKVQLFVDDHDPQKGWVKNSICFGYQYCAYDLIESYDSTEDKIIYDRGYSFEFKEEDVKFYDYLSKVWITASRTNPSGAVEKPHKEPPPKPIPIVLRPGKVDIDNGIEAHNKAQAAKENNKENNEVIKIISPPVDVQAQIDDIREVHGLANNRKGNGLESDAQIQKQLTDEGADKDDDDEQPEILPPPIDGDDINDKIK
ncbi:mannosyltransferase [Scheffersomyces coipomensis]|uniref:mannosyltransferase n=1 Tax=Scheffersomyces coipomensis TaxID=1788519 RepID=UPI00315C68BA